MKTTIGELRGAMKKAMKAANKGNCGIEIKNNFLSVKASSMEGAVIIQVPADGTVDDCNASLSQKQIISIFNGVADTISCNFKKLEGGIAISFAGVRIKLLHLYDGEADSILTTANKLQKEKAFSTNGTKLAKIVDGPLNYAAKNDVRVFLTGAFFESDDGFLRVTGTDGIKLCTVKSDISASPATNFILPASAADAIHTVFGDDEFSVEMVGLGDKMRILFSNERIRWIATLIGGTYPNWRKVMPKKHRYAQVTVDRDELVRAVNRITAVSDSTHAALVFSEDGLTVQSIDGEQREKFDFASTLVTEKTPFPFNGKLLVNAVSCVETSKVDLYLDGAELTTSKVVFNPDSIDDGKTMKDWIGFMMPLQIQVTV